MEQYLESRQRATALYEWVFRLYESKCGKKSTYGDQTEVLAKCKMFIQSYSSRLLQQPANKNTGAEMEFWRQFVAEFFSNSANVGICMSSYESNLSDTPQQWKRMCGSCQPNPGFGFDFTREFLPGLCMLVYANYDKMKDQFQLEDMDAIRNASSGMTLLKAALIRRGTVRQDKVQLRTGLLKVAFTPDMKICAAELCIHNDREPQLVEAHPMVDSNTKALLEQARRMLDLPEEEEEGQGASTSRLPNPNEPLNIAKKEFIRSLQGSDVAQMKMDLMNFTTKHRVPSPAEIMAASTSAQRGGAPTTGL